MRVKPPRYIVKSGALLLVSCTPGVATAQCNYSTDDHTVALYHFDDGLVDSVGHHDGVAFGDAATNGQGVWGGGLGCVSSGYVRLGNVHQNPTRSIAAGTVECWARINTRTGISDAILANGRDRGGNFNDGIFLGNHMAFSPNLFFAFWSGSTTIIVDSGVDYETLLGSWHHFGLSWGSQGLQLWLDGRVVATNGFTGALPNATYQTFLIASDSYSQDAAAQYDELRISDIQRDLSELPGPPQLAGPESASVCRNGAAILRVDVFGLSAMTFGWQHESDNGQWADVVTGFLPYSHGTIAVTGVDTDQLHLALNTLPGAPPIRFRCLVTNSCGGTTSQPATVQPCEADFTCDGQVDDADFVGFVAAYNILDCADPAMPQACAADLSGDGFVDDSDFVLFVLAYDELGCL